MMLSLFISNLIFSDALAGGLEPKTSVSYLPNRSLQRRLVLGKGWFEISLGSTYKDAIGYWNPNGIELQSGGESLAYTPFDSASWLYTTQSMNFRYGLLNRAELYWNFTSHYVSLQNPKLGTDIDQFGVGDPEFGFKFELTSFDKAKHKKNPNKIKYSGSSSIIYTHYKAPLANESPGNYVGGPNTFSQFVLTTGTSDWSFGYAYKNIVTSTTSFDFDVQYKVRISGLALYAIETDNNQFSIRVKPGNELIAKAHVSTQAGPLFLSTGALFTLRGHTKIGNTVDGLVPSLQLDEIESSDGWALDSVSTAILNLGQRYDLVGSVTVPIRGEDLLFFPLESIHPTYGITYAGYLTARF